MTVFDKLKYDELLIWTACVQMRARLAPSTITPKMLLGTLPEMWVDEDDYPESDDEVI